MRKRVLTTENEAENKLLIALRRAKANKSNAPPVFMVRVVGEHYQLFRAIPMGQCKSDNGLTSGDKIV
jgi:hypothetical protein